MCVCVGGGGEGVAFVGHSMGGLLARCGVCVGGSIVGHSMGGLLARWGGSGGGLGRGGGQEEVQEGEGAHRGGGDVGTMRGGAC